MREPTPHRAEATSRGVGPNIACLDPNTPLRRTVGLYTKHASLLLLTNSKLLTPTLPKDSKFSCRKLGAPKPSEGLAPKTFKVSSSRFRSFRAGTPKTSSCSSPAVQVCNVHAGTYHRTHKIESPNFRPDICYRDCTIGNYNFRAT